MRVQASEVTQMPYYFVYAKKLTVILLPESLK